MRKAVIIRYFSDDQGTQGKFVSQDFSCYSFELPDRNNQPGRGCIPSGAYITRVVKTPHHGLVYMVFGVVKRSSILEHSGNYAGDITKGYKSHVLGCILLGKYFGYMNGQKAILYSRPTVKAMMQAMNNEDVELTIIDAFKRS